MSAASFLVRVPRRRLLFGLTAIAVAIAGAAFLATRVGGAGGANGGTGDNASSTSIATVTRRSLASQTQVSATLGYAEASSVVVPAGTTAAAVLQAQQALATAEATLQTAQATLSADRRALERVQATLAADRQKQAIDCRGDNAAESGGGGSATATAGPCATAHQAVATDEQSLAADQDKVAADQRGVTGAGVALGSARTGLDLARSSATAYGSDSTYTMLPAVGQIVRRGQPLYAIGSRPVLLLYGSVTAWRPFAAGMSAGPDVAELNANLRALGYGSHLVGDNFSAATRAAIVAFQHARGLAPTGELLLGSMVFKPGSVRVTSVQPTLGGTVAPGPVLGVSSTKRLVTIALDATQQAAIKVGDNVTITLPDNRTTPGVVSSVGTVATTPSSSNGAPQTPTVEVDVTPTDPAATGRLDQAPVEVSIVTSSVSRALVVPVSSLLALAGGGYAVETVDSAGGRHLVAVSLGLFDDAAGLVQVTDTNLAPGQHVVVPST